MGRKRAGAFLMRDAAFILLSALFSVLFDRFNGCGSSVFRIRDRPMHDPLVSKEMVASQNADDP